MGAEPVRIPMMTACMQTSVLSLLLLSLWGVPGWAEDEMPTSAPSAATDRTKHAASIAAPSNAGVVSPSKPDPFTDDAVELRKEPGVQLLLPRDWPVQQEHGVRSPIAIEKYLSMKFGQVKEKFSDTDRRFNELERRLDQLEEDNKLLQKRLRLLEERPSDKEVPHGDTTQTP